MAGDTGTEVAGTKRCPKGNGKNTHFIPVLQEAIEGLCSKRQPSSLVFSQDYSGYHAETSCRRAEVPSEGHCPSR